jgi:hypothetical protein
VNGIVGVLLRLYLPFVLIAVGAWLLLSNLPTVNISTGISGPPNWIVWVTVGLALTVAGFAVLLRRAQGRT